MLQKLLLILSLFIFSCHTKQAEKKHSEMLSATRSTPTTIQSPEPLKEKNKKTLFDTTSSDYLLYLLKNEKAVNNYWIKKLAAVDIALYDYDPASRFLLEDHWSINDSIGIVLLQLSTGVGSHTYLLTMKDKKQIISTLQIGDNADSDLSIDNPYYYTNYKLINHKKVKLFNYKTVLLKNDEEKDSLISTENWLIKDNGVLVKI